MLATAFISWWYGDGWKLVVEHAKRRLDRTLASFSVPTLAKTLFAPWKRITADPGAGLSAHFRAAVDNAISRLVGFTIRFFVLIAAGLSMCALAATAVLQAILWPLVPVLIVFCIIRGIT
jgi:hypothetical protein